MIFLKKFIANGFKSFAHKVEIDFKHQMSGIVGPNGSGKSNIIDAIKWVLGEKSNKMLRGKVSEDVIFHGSNGQDASKYAEITLVFDNKNRSLHYDLDEVSVTRRLTKGDGNNEYFLNGEPCRLKEILEMFLDTGLSKGSLGIISQGTVQWFVDAKPEERRNIFEDAAGIGLYAKKRDEAVRNLEHTQENLNRLSDICNELETQLKKLQKQADKALIYAEKQKELKKLDLTIMVKDLKYFTERLKVIDQNLVEAKDKLQVFEPNVKEITSSLNFAKQKQETAEKNIDVLTQEFNQIIEKINRLEIRKSSLDSQLQTDLSSENIETKLQAYNALISSTKFTINEAKKNIDSLTTSVNTYNDIINDLTKKKDQLNNEAIIKSNKLVEIRTKIKQIVESVNDLNSHNIGVKTILENKQAINGIIGPVADFIKYDNEYELAYKVALGKSVENIIVERNADAENAVDFLKQNKAGKATFLPLESILPKSLKPEHYEAIQNQPGFIGIANELAEYEQKYNDVFGFLLGNVIFSDNLDHAFNLSRLTYKLYKVVTLDGDLIAPGGSVSGGYTNKKSLSNVSNPKQLLEELNKEYPLVNDQYLKIKQELDKVSNDLNEVLAKASEKKILLSRYEESLRTNENQLLKYETDYQQLLKTSNSQIEANKVDVLSIDEELTRLNNRKNKINEDLNVNRNSKAIFKSQITDQEAKLNEIRYQIDAARDVITKHEVERVKCETLINNAKTRISQDYRMTLEFAMENYTEELPMTDSEARTIIDRLRNEIARLGPINMEALNEVEVNKERYNSMLTQKQDVEKAKASIEHTIAELDKKAINDFKTTIDKVNETLPEVFKYLFGGGTCRIEYTDPSNILTSGIDVSVAPFGKNITRLSLLSGGEKSLVALSILFTILKIKSFPLVILDEAESALDPANVERFANIIQESSDNTQFLIITHRPGTMERCDVLFGATMQNKGVTSIYEVELNQAKEEFANDDIKQGVN
ncbi:MAG: AAA family ATPase [Mycoplasma sp.]